MNKLLRDISSRLDESERGNIPRRNDLDRIGQELAALLRAPTYREAEKEYVPSDAFAIYFNAKAEPVLWSTDAPIQIPAFVVYIRFSWTSPYVMVDWKRTDDGKTWLAVSTDQLPTTLRDVSNSLERFLKDQDNEVLFGPILNEILPGRLSELDDSPQTVREALFSALD